MPQRTLRRMAPPLTFAIAAIGLGIFAGTVTVQGMEADRYGAGAMSAQLDAAGYPDEVTDASYREASYAEGCDGCSERDLGYRWAGLRQLGSADDCPTDSWGFNRGCVAYFRDLTGV